MSTNIERIQAVAFPTARGLAVNMMPIVMGRPETVPAWLSQYLPMVDACALEHGSTVYLSVHESWVQAGQTQRRPGVHTDGGAAIGWGGGQWGSTARERGIYMASTDGRCRAWDCQAMSDHPHGSMDAPTGEAVPMDPSVLYWLTDRTPHESLPAERTAPRQWFRLVADAIGGWWAEHSTANPLGVQPNAPILLGSKFAV